MFYFCFKGARNEILRGVFRMLCFKKQKSQSKLAFYILALLLDITLSKQVN